MLWCGASGRGFLRKAAILFGILLTFVLAGLVLTPQFIDLDRFKGPIAAQLGKRIGLPVELTGPIALSLLPTPTLTARAVRIANPPGAAAADMVRLRALEVKPALLPLLAGRIELGSASLIDPEIDLERLPDGRMNWESAGPPTGEAGGRSQNSAAAATPVALLDRLVLQNGAVTWRFAGGIERFEHINAVAMLDEAAGGIGATGSLVARGADLSFELHSGALGAAVVPLQLTITTRPAARLQLDGELTGPVDDRHIAGQIVLTGADAQAVLGTLARVPLPAALAQPLAVKAELAGSAAALQLDHLAVDLGPAHAEGKLRLAAGAPPDLALTLSLPQLDLDRWPMPEKAAASSPTLFGAGFSALTGEVRIPGQRETGGEALPTGIAVSLDLGAQAIEWRGRLIRDAHLTLSLAAGKVTLSRLAALLPGGSDAMVSGTLALTPQGARADGRLAFSADDLRSLLAWFGAKLDAIPADRLLKANLSSRLALAGDQLELTDIDATIDATRLAGAATVLLRARPGLGLRLAADRLNLDAYLPAQSAAAAIAATPQPAPLPPAPEGPVALAVPSEVAALLTSFDANVDGRVGALTWRGQPMNDVHLSATLQSGDATIHELSIGDLGGATAKLSGVVSGLAGLPTGQLAFDMRGPELERVLRVLSPRLQSPRSYGPFSLGGGVQCDKHVVTIDTDLDLLDGHAHVVGDIARPGGKLDLGFDLGHPSFEHLVQSLGPLYQPPGDPGAVKLSGRLEGDWNKFTLEHLALAIGESTLSGSLGVDLTGAKPRLDADLTAGDWTIDRFLPPHQTAWSGQTRVPALLPVAATLPPPAAAATPWSDAPIKLGLLRRADLDLKFAAHSLAYGGWRIDSPVVSGALADSVLSLKQVTGQMLGGSVEASGTIDARAVPAMAMQLALKQADFKSLLAGSDLLEGRFDLNASLSGAGASEAQMIAHAAGKAALQSSAGSLGGVNLKTADETLATHPGDLLALLRGSGGRTSFSALAGDFQLAEGIATSDDLHLDAEGGEGHATVRLDLPQWQMASRVELTLAGAPAAPPLVMRLDGALDAPRVVFDVNALEQYLAQDAAKAKPARPEQTKR
jgi:uncharacterized protein involved in outer membrane biogenesis